MQIHASKRLISHAATAACGLSAFSALVYQSLWLRGFGLAYGGSSASIALVLAVFMGGLALGSLWARRMRTHEPLRAYALAEAGLGLSALLAQLGLSRLPGFLSGLALGSHVPMTAEALVKASLACLLLLPSAACAGLTLPLLLDQLEREGAHEGRSFGRLYAANALGAALGALATAFVLLPMLGVLGATLAAAAVNLTLAAAAWKLAPSRTSQPAPTPQPGLTPQASPGLYAALAGLSGVAAFVLEALWTRSLTLVLGSSAFSFALMLCATLCGIALGSALYARRPRTARLQGLATGYALLAALTLLSAYALGRLPEAYFSFMRHVTPSFALYQGFGFALALLCLLPVTLAQGYLFPMLLKLSEGQGARRDSATLYLYNSLGAVAGALLGGFWLLPRFGIQSSFGLVAGLTLALAALCLPGGIRVRTYTLAAALAAALLGGAFFRPWETLLVTSGSHQAGIALAGRLPAEQSFKALLRQQYALEHYQEGAEAVVAVRRGLGDGELSLVINGKVDASLRGDLITQSLLAHIPLLLKPQAKSVLVIGWGSGCTVGSVAAHPVSRIACVEIEPAVFATAPLFRSINSEKWQPGAASGPPVWEDPRFTLRLADARQDLLRRKEVYDVIISEPSNPWISGVANLYTREFYQVAQRRLATNGIFAQWFHFYSMEAIDIQRQLRTFGSVFPVISVWMVPQKAGEQAISGDMILIGSNHEPDLASSALLERLAVPSVSGDLMRADCCGISEDPAAPLARDRWWFNALRLLDDKDARAYAGVGSLNTDDRPRLEFSAPRSLYRSMQAHAEANVRVFRALEAAAHEEPPTPPDVQRALALARLGEHYSQRNLGARAITTLRAAEAGGIKDTRLNLALGQAYYFRGQRNEAEPYLRKAFLSSSQGYVAFLKHGGEYLKAGRPDLALGIFDMALSIKSDDGDSHFGRGISLARLGRRTEALAAIQKSLRLKPHLEVAQKALQDLGGSPQVP